MSASIVSTVQQEVEPAATVGAALGTGLPVAASNSSHRERHQLLLETFGVIPWEIDLASYKLKYIGPQVVRIFGYPLEKWFEADFWLNHLHPEDRERAMEFYGSYTACGVNHEFEYRFFTADGSVVWVHDIVTVIRDSDSDKATLIGVMVDITRQKELRRR